MIDPGASRELDGVDPYVQVLDSVRFVAAFCVLLHHTIGVPWRLAPFGWTWVPELLGSLWFGSAAVVVFFVISGYCVHAPYVARKGFDLPEFLVRRILRLLLPLGAALVLARLAGVSYHPLYGMITWSLVCELCYYLCYPALRGIIATRHWLALIGSTLVVGYGFLAVVPRGTDSLVAGLLPAILTYAPGWFAGCWLAEQPVAAGSARDLWPWRVAVLASATVIGLLHYTGVIDLAWSLPLFPLVVTPWLANELNGPRRATLLSRQGRWSYSLYLVHPAAFHAFSVGLGMIGLGPMAGRIPAILATLAAAFLFYVAIEKPSHGFVRRLAARFRREGPGLLPRVAPPSPAGRP